MLPDVLSRPFYILFPALHWWVMPLHTPVGMVIVCWSIAGLFQSSERRRVFIALAGGVFVSGLDQTVVVTVLPQVIADLEKNHTGIAARVLDDQGKLRRFVNVYVNDDDVRLKLLGSFYGCAARRSFSTDFPSRMGAEKRS